MVFLKRERTISDSKKLWEKHRKLRGTDGGDNVKNTHVRDNTWILWSITILVVKSWRSYIKMRSDGVIE